MKINKLCILQPPLEGGYKHKKIMPLGIGYILAVLRKVFPELELKFIDMQSSGMSFEQAVNTIKFYKPDLFLISYWTPMADYAYKLIDLIKPYLPETSKIISGGVHSSIFPEEALKKSDIVVRFEGEVILIELINALRNNTDLKNVKGISFKVDNQIIHNDNQGFINNLDELPFPAWDLLPMENYTTPMHVTGGKRLPVMGSRGCPYGCSYCVSPFFWKRKLRWRSPENVVDEIENIVKELGVNQIHFWDDNLFINPNYIEEICSEIVRRNLKIVWLGLTRASHILKCEHLFELLKRSGCIGMEMGIESADPTSHKAVNKEESLDITMKAADLLKKYGLYPMFTYMCLNPGDTLNTYYNQAEFIDKILEGCGWIDYFHPLPIPLYIGQICTPHPGTKLYDDAHNLGIVNAKKWTDYYHHRVNFIPNTLLDDVPIKIQEKLSYREILLCVKGMVASVYKYVQPEDKLLTRICKIAEYIDFIKHFFELCSGTLKIREISAKLKLKLKLSDDKTYNYLGITIVVLSQLGFIQSKFNDHKLKIRNIDISGLGNAMKLAQKLHVIDLFTPYLKIMNKLLRLN